MFNLETVGTNSFEPVSLADVKTHSRIDTSAEDDYISNTLIPFARQQVENDLNMAIVDQEYKLHLAHWLELRFLNSILTGDYFVYDVYPQYDYFLYHPKIILPVMPIQAVNSITYTDVSGDPQTLDPSFYRLQTWKDPVHILYLNTALPAIQNLSDIVVDFVAGYASADVVPPLVKQAVLFCAGYSNENREGDGDSDVNGYQRVINLLRISRFR